MGDDVSRSSAAERRAAALVDSWRLDDLPVDLGVLKADIARVISDAVAAERERCARVLDDLGHDGLAGRIREGGAT